MPVDGSDGTPTSLPTAGSGGSLAHQLINSSNRDAGILQPGREGVPQVVRPMQVQAVQAGPARRQPIGAPVGAERQRRAIVPPTPVTASRPAEDQPIGWAALQRRRAASTTRPAMGTGRMLVSLLGLGL